MAKLAKATPTADQNLIPERSPFGGENALVVSIVDAAEPKIGI
jgi:hypothetical protein